MEISKEYAEQLVKDALELLYQAHHKYYKDTCTDEEMEKDEMIVDAIEALQEIEK